MVHEGSNNDRGKGTRIAEINADVPKPMITICGKPILQHQIECLEKQGIIAYGRSILLKLSNKDKVVINHYDKGNKLVMQGKPRQLFSAILSYVTELVEVEEIPRIYNDTYKVNIDKKEIYSEFQYYLPNAYDKLPEKMSKTLHQAVYNLKLDGDMFEKVGAKYRLYSDRCGKATFEQIKYIGNCYTFFHNNRHELSHWDDPTPPLDTTKLLDVERAYDLIKRALLLIDEYYE